MGGIERFVRTRFLDQSLISSSVERLTKNGTRTVDARTAVVSADTRPNPTGDDLECATLDMVVRHVTPAVRPDDILTGLQSVAGLELLDPPRATRLAQGLLDATGQIADPLGPL